MTLALRLCEKGYRVFLIEGSTELGGLASSRNIGKYTWDRFYHVILMSDLNLIKLLEELKLSDKLNWGQTKTGFYTDGQLYSMSNSIEFLTFPPLNFFDKVRLGWTIFYASKIKDWQKLEQISVADWLKRLSGKRTFNKIWLPLLKSKLGENYQIASASFIWAIIARMYAARRSGLKQEMFGYVTGGYETILDRYRNHLRNMGVEILTQTLVTKASNSNGVELETASGESLKFDEVILTLPTSQIPAICPQISLPERKRFKDITYQGIICAALILKQQLAGYYVTNITEEWVPFTAVIEMTALVDKSAFNGNTLVYLPRYLTKDDPYWEKSDDVIQREFLDALQRMYPSFTSKDVVAFDIVRAKDVFPVTTLNYSSDALPSSKITLENIFVVNSSQIPNGTMNVNEIIGLANQKSEEIARLINKDAPSKNPATLN